MVSLGKSGARMNDYDDPPQGVWKKRLIWAAVLVGGPLLLLIGVGAFASFVGTPEQQFDRMAENEPEVKQLLGAMRQHFPDEYQAFRKTLIPHIERGAEPLAIRTASAAFMREFNTRHRYEVARAPDKELKAFFEAQLKMFEQVGKQSEALCGSIAQGRTMPPGLHDKANAPLLGALSARFIEAAAAGRDNPSGRGGPTNADRMKLGVQLQTIGLRPDVRKLMEANRPPQLYDDGQMCNATLSVLRALARLPLDAALRIEGEVVQTS